MRVTEKQTRGRVTYTADDEGQFSGVFPHINPAEAAWDLSVTFADPPSNVELTDIKPTTASDSMVEFDIALPSTSIEGNVVDESGAPRGGMVTVIPPVGGPARTSGSTGMIQAAADDATGHFSVPGLSAGNYEVYAVGGDESPDGELIESPVSVVRVSRHRPTSVRLVLAKQSHLTGRVTTVEGAPLPGARLDIRSADSSRPWKRLYSDASGLYSAALPSDTRTLLVDVSMPTVGRRFFLQPVPKSHELNITLEPNGGRLTLDNVEASALTVLLFHDGAYATGSDLLAWSQVNGEQPADDRLSIPLLDPGEYTVCRSGNRNDTPLHLAETGIAAGRCIAGSLPRGGALDLTVPGKKMPADVRVRPSP